MGKYHAPKVAKQSQNKGKVTPEPKFESMQNFYWLKMTFVVVTLKMFGDREDILMCQVVSGGRQRQINDNVIATVNNTPTQLPGATKP